MDGNGLIGSSDLIYIFRKLGDYDITEREVFLNYFKVQSLLIVISPTVLR